MTGFTPDSDACRSTCTLKQFTQPRCTRLKTEKPTKRVLLGTCCGLSSHHQVPDCTPAIEIPANNHEIERGLPGVHTGNRLTSQQMIGDRLTRPCVLLIMLSSSRP